MLPAVFADLVNGQDVRVLESAGRLRLRAEAGHVVRRGEATRKDQLQRHDAIEADLPGPPDDALAPPGDSLEQFVIARNVSGRPAALVPPTAVSSS